MFVFFFHVVRRKFAEIDNLSFVGQLVLRDATGDQQHLVLIHYREADEGLVTGQPEGEGMSHYIMKLSSITIASLSSPHHMLLYAPRSVLHCSTQNLQPINSISHPHHVGPKQALAWHLHICTNTLQRVPSSSLTRYAVVHPVRKIVR